MIYPLTSEYIEAIRNSEDNFEKLADLRPVLDSGGNPVMSSGNFAVVFKMQNVMTGKLYAVKCFTKEQEGREEAYRLICDELAYTNNAYLVPINYMEGELYVDSHVTGDTEFPVVLMDWVDAIPLDAYIRQVSHDQAKLCELAFRFSKMAHWLLTQPFAHGDLKNDNILVREDGSLVLVDYDGMYVPAMKGTKSREMGSPNFRHPNRTEEVFDQHIDDFALCMMTMALRAVMLDASLLSKYPMADALLFRAADFRDIAHSPLHADLCALLYDKAFEKAFALFHLALSDEALPEPMCQSIVLPFDLRQEVGHFEELGPCGDEAFCKFNADTGELRIYGKGKMKDFGIFGANTPWRYNRASISKVSIAHGITTIEDGAFYDCTGLTEIHLPSSLTSIGYYAFSGCTGLTTIDLPASLTSIGDCAFSGCI